MGVWPGRPSNRARKVGFVIRVGILFNAVRRVGMLLVIVERVTVVKRGLVGRGILVV